VERRELNVLLSERELAARRSQTTIRRPTAARGYERLYLEQVEQAHLGSDFTFLKHIAAKLISAPL
jgi:dihydroxyacid dehydratase/phosphogluconate dehydratase